MKRFLLLVAVALVSCSKSNLVSEFAPIGTWQTECLPGSKFNHDTSLSFKGVVRTNGSSAGAVITKFLDGACTKPYATINYDFASPETEKTDSVNYFILRSEIRKVSFVAHAQEALTNLAADAHDIAVEDLVLEKSIDVTDKGDTFDVASLKMVFIFQFKKEGGEEYDQELARIYVTRGLDERTEKFILEFPQAKKVSNH